MEKVFRDINEEKGVVQITTVDERWYAFEDKNKTTGLPMYSFLPSVTWICEHYPKGIAFYKWLANHGWDEAESLKNAAGDKGSKIHYAITDLLSNKSVKMTSKYLNHSTELLEELTVEEYQAVISFKQWYDEVKPKTLAVETLAINPKEKYAGMIDYECEIDGQKWIVDFKSSLYIWPSHELQVSAYRHSNKKYKDHKTAILQVGYTRNKNKKYKFTEIEDNYDQFLAAKVIWEKEQRGVQPKQIELPLEISLKETTNAISK